MLNLITKIQSIRNVGRYSQIVRLVPGAEGLFPSYEAGQHATLKRHFDGMEKIFSIASAPSETFSRGYLEFYVSADVGKDKEGMENIESFFNSRGHQTEFLLKEIGGSFTLQQQGNGYRHFVMVATGTGISPFRSMIKELRDKALPQHLFEGSITLLQSHRTVEELAYFGELLAIEKEKRYDFFYVPTLTRKNEEATIIQTVSFGRVGSLLKMLFMEQADILQSDNIRFSSHEIPDRLLERIKPEETLMMLCGNPEMVDEVRLLADSKRIACVSEAR